jgi:hypothetical protein
MLLWLGYGLSVLSAIWLSRFGIVSGGSESARTIPAPTPNLPSFQLALPAEPVSASLQTSKLGPFNLGPHVSSTLTTLEIVVITSVQNAVPVSPSSSAFSQPPIVVHGPSVAIPVSPSSPSQSQSPPGGLQPEIGQDYGRTVIFNHCNKTISITSEGAHALGGFRDGKGSKGWGTDADQIKHKVDPGGNYTEPWRTTCPLLTTGLPTYCDIEDKLRGQGVSMKVQWEDASPPNVSEAINILQVEYALVKNPMRGDTFLRLDYDISLLDCGNPMNYPKVYHVNIPPPAETQSSAPGAPPIEVWTYDASWRNVTELTDVKATENDHAVKLDKCPGYQNGVAVTFPSDKEGKKCPPIHCDGKEKCMSIYTFDRTREGEASMACHEEYRGDMVVHLCAGAEGS